MIPDIKRREVFVLAKPHKPAVGTKGFAVDCYRLLSEEGEKEVMKGEGRGRGEGE